MRKHLLMTCAAACALIAASAFPAAASAELISEGTAVPVGTTVVGHSAENSGPLLLMGGRYERCNTAMTGEVTKNAKAEVKMTVSAWEFYGSQPGTACEGSYPGAYVEASAPQCWTSTNEGEEVLFGAGACGSSSIEIGLKTTEGTCHYRRTAIFKFTQITNSPTLTATAKNNVELALVSGPTFCSTKAYLEGLSYAYRTAGGASLTLN